MTKYTAFLRDNPHRLALLRDDVSTIAEVTEETFNNVLDRYKNTTTFHYTAPNGQSYREYELFVTEKEMAMLLLMFK